MAGRQLVFVQQPTRVRIPNAISPPVRLEVRAGDIIDPRVIDGEVTIGVLSGPPGGQIIGASTARCPNGVATFDDLRFNVPGTYTLIAECDEDKLDLAGLVGHSSLMFFDVANGVDEGNRLICERTGYVLHPTQNFNLPPLIESPLGENSARRFIRSNRNRWEGQDQPEGLDDWIMEGCMVHCLYRQHREQMALPGEVFNVPHTGGGAPVIRVMAGFDVNQSGNPPLQYFDWTRRTLTRGHNLESWSLLSMGGKGGEFRVYVNGLQSGAPGVTTTSFQSKFIWIGNNLNGDIAQIGIEPVSSLEDMDAKALHAAQMCRVAP